VRGGAWNNLRDNARCAYRNRNHPDNRNDNLGFRVVLSHVLPFFWFRLRAGWRAGVLRRSRFGNAGRSVLAGLPAEAKEEEQRQRVCSARTIRADSSGRMCT